LRRETTEEIFVGASLKEPSPKIKWLDFEIFNHKNEDTPIRRSDQEDMKLPQVQKLEEKNMGVRIKRPCRVLISDSVSFTPD
jgi:hypothetical protein